MLLTLQAVKTYMQAHEVVHMPQLMRHFQTDAATLKPLLDHWQRKGHLQRYFPPNCGSGCVQCLPELRQAFRWCG